MSDLSVGLYIEINFQIEVIDETRTRTTHHHQFSLDGTRVKTKFLPRLFLMPNLGMIVSALNVYFASFQTG